jgi:hypothetical protein
MDQKNEETFSLEENLRQRAYYEKYYEDLASHAAQMDKIGQHEIAEEDREEMKNASRILGDLVREKQANYDQQNSSTSQEKTLPQEKADQQVSQAARTPETTNEQAQSNDYEIDDIPEEDRIKVDKSHFTDEALEAEARADAQLAADEAAMDERIKQVEAEFNQEAQQDNDIAKSESQSNKQDESVDPAPSQDDYYGYGY